MLAQCIGEVLEGPVAGDGSRWAAVAEELAVRYGGPASVHELRNQYGWEYYLVCLRPRDSTLVTWQGPDLAQAVFRSWPTSGPWRPKRQLLRGQSASATLRRAVEKSRESCVRTLTKDDR